MSALYKIQLNGEEMGPLSLQQLVELDRDGELSESTPIRPVTVESVPWAAWGQVLKANQSDVESLKNPSWNRPSSALSMVPTSDKSRTNYVVLGVLLGSLGIHNFYAERYTVGVIQFVATLILTLLIGLGGLLVGIWAIFEVITNTDDGQGHEMKW